MPGRREAEIAAVRPHRVEHAREVPRWPFVRWRIIEAIRFGRWMVRHVAKIPLDAHRRIRHRDADLEAAPDNWSRPVLDKLLRGGQVLHDIVLQVMSVRSEEHTSELQSLRHLV